MDKISDKEIQELREKSQKYADSKGINLNPNDKFADGILHGLLKNKKLKGEFYCPCRVQTGDKEKDKSIICPCEFNLEEIKAQGYCHCGLFVA
ncbi:MAG: ferredoxin-thioredoxin reductase catalytic domain-containing protein [Candidatus Nanoarchaeia archaeon]|nr:ferredoxin-thioredoxin reductase catalytic domain-containing protein [Candidatus Nanoarchaeia archaeon]